MGKILGIIGGGQLGMMLTEAAKKMPEHISKVIVLDPNQNCSASLVGAEQITADFKDKDAIVELSKKADVITYEIESGDSEVLKSVENNAEINPSPETLKIIQDKFLQKTFLQNNNIPIPEFIKVESLDEVKEGLKKFGYPALLKARRDAYDGKGNFKIDSENEVEKAYDYFKGQKLMLEKFVPFKMEVSVIASRNTNGEIKTFPLVENIHEKNILRQTIAPARTNNKVSQKASKIASDTMDVLKGAGVFGIEMFVTQNDDIVINEIAPRVHNSGHHTLQSSKTSQFEQHLRAILGLDLGNTQLMHNTIMYNILGNLNFEGEYKKLDFSKHNVFLKMYGKKISKPLRKLGHLNLVGSNNQTIDELLTELSHIKDKVEVKSIWLVFMLWVVNYSMALKAAMVLAGISIVLLVLYGADVAVSMGNSDKEGFLPLDDMQRGMGLGGPAIILPIIAFFIALREKSKGLGGLIIVSGILILIGGLAMIGTPAPEGVERNPIMLFAPAIIQLALGAIKIVKS